MAEHEMASLVFRGVQDWRCYRSWTLTRTSQDCGEKLRKMMRMMRNNLKTEGPLCAGTTCDGNRLLHVWKYDILYLMMRWCDACLVHLCRDLFKSHKKKKLKTELIIRSVWSRFMSRFNTTSQKRHWGGNQLV